jgi:hypothetical protein
MSTTTVPNQHPAVVLRSHYRALKALLAIAMIAVAGLTTAVVILAIDDDSTTSTATVAPLNGAVHKHPLRSSSTSSGSSESTVAAAIGSQPSVATPDESKIAASIAAGVNPDTFEQTYSTERTGGPDESKTAQAVSRR